MSFFGPLKDDFLGVTVQDIAIRVEASGAQAIESRLQKFGSAIEYNLRRFRGRPQMRRPRSR
ncbi:MAG: hypothetical protein WDO18_10775 [Acidobacteriota bacterium]